MSVLGTLMARPEKRSYSRPPAEVAGEVVTHAEAVVGRDGVLLPVRLLLEADGDDCVVPGAHETEQLAVEGGIDSGVTKADERSAAVHQLLAMKDHRVVRV